MTTQYSDPFVGMTARPNGRRVAQKASMARPFLLRLEGQPMRGSMVDRLRRKRQREGASVIVGVPLIVVVIVEDVAPLAVHDVECRLVKVGEVDSQALRRPEPGGHLHDRVLIARPGLTAGACGFLQDGEVTPEGMRDVHAMHAAPSP